MFDASATQRNLNTVANAGLKVDGVAGPKTFSALMVRAAGIELRKLPLVPDLATALVARLDLHAINTPLRVRHLLARACVETDHFQTLTEYGSAAYFQRYDNRRDLGNNQPGDGGRFRGRGLLQTTGRANYAALRDATGLDCVNHPEMLADPETAVEAAVRYWSSRKINDAADRNDIRAVCKLINGGLNGLADQMVFFERLAVIQ